MGRYIAIGDIHGMAEMFDGLVYKLQDQFGMDKKDTIILLGDYIDRGKSSSGVIDRCLGLSRKYPKTVFLRGNHEQLMIDSMKNKTPLVDEHGEPCSISAEVWLGNGGVETLESYGINKSQRLKETWWYGVPYNHRRFLHQTEMEYMTDRYCFVHAGVLPPDEIWQTYGVIEYDPRLWIRNGFLQYQEPFEDGRIVVFGHTPQKDGKPLVEANKIGIDTGAFYGDNHPLTAVILDDEGSKPIFVQQYPVVTNDRRASRNGG